MTNAKVQSTSRGGIDVLKKGGLRSNGIVKRSALNRPLISVIIPVLNGSNTIEIAINSILNQSYTNIEIIIMDGCSSDNTIEIINKYATIIDYFESSKDRGVYDAMNKGIEEAHGDWIYFLGADDEMFDTIEQVVLQLDPNYDAVYGDVLIKKNNEIYSGSFNSYMLAFKNICHQSIFYNKCTLKHIKFNLRYKTLADYELNLRLFNNMKYISVVIATYNETGGLSKTILDVDFKKDKLKLVNRYLGWREGFILFTFIFTGKLLNILSLKKHVKKILKTHRQNFE